MKWLFILIIICLFSSTCTDIDHDSDIHQLVVGLPINDPAKDPGFALKILSGDSVVLETSEGVEDIHSLTPINANSLFNIGSISKTFVAFGILRLASEGKLSLTDSLIKYFPNFKKPEIGHKVRLYHLLTHSSGLPDCRKIKQDSIFYLTADDAQNWAPILENDSLHFEPGSKFEYSNPAFNALALIIQQITGIKWQDYIKNNIFNPSKMTRSTITAGAHPDTGVTHAYIPASNHQWQELDYGEEPTFNASGNGGVWSSINDLSRYEHAIRRNEFVNSEIRKLSRTIYPLKEWSDSLPSQLGLSWFISKYQGYEMYSHTGSQGGFTADFVSIPDAGFFYCILTNTPIDIDHTRDHVLEHASKKGWIKNVK